jgi:SAM-dependent methyltransferase
MPYSYGEFKNEVRQHLIENFKKDISILDVGCGAGTYSRLLKDHFNNIDGVEIFENYFSMFNLYELYNNLFRISILDFDYSNYDYIIMGDILEHLSIEESTKLLENIQELGIKTLVAVPYLYEQGEEFGNIYETHHQPDLTPEIFLERYPMMRLLFGDDKYGYYVNY